MSARLYVAVDEALPPGPRLAQCAHVVAEIHARQPEACAAWRSGSNTVVVVTMDGNRLARLAARPGVEAFREPDLGNELTAVAVFPSDDETRRDLRRARLAA